MVYGDNECALSRVEEYTGYMKWGYGGEKRLYEVSLWEDECTFTRKYSHCVFGNFYFIIIIIMGFGNYVGIHSECFLINN